MYAVHITEVRCVLQTCPPLFTVRNGKRSIMDGKGDEKKMKGLAHQCVPKVMELPATSFSSSFFFFHPLLFFLNSNHSFSTSLKITLI